MHIRAGYELIYDCPAPVALLMMISLHRSRMQDLLTEGAITFSGGAIARTYEDCFANTCTRVQVPAGRLVIATDFVVQDSGLPDPMAPHARVLDVPDLPDDVLLFLLGSRYCETDRLSDIAWSQFSHLPRDWNLVQAIVDFVHRHIRFDYQRARPTRTAWEAYQEREGVCR